jgi:putative peptide zinc metalloprotease protein
LRADLAIQQASLREFEARYQQAWVSDRVQAQMLQQDIEAIKAAIQYLQSQVKQLDVISPVEGMFRITSRHVLVGSYVRQGDEFALVEAIHDVRARAALTQEEVGLVRQSLAGIEIRLASNLAKTLPATIIQEVPAATRELPSQALGAQGGGRLPVDAAQMNGTRAADDVFLVDLGVTDVDLQGRYGERVYVKFVHPAQSGAVQLYRALQQLFIRSFS